MKRVLFIATFLLATLCQQSAKAQSFGDLLKGLSGLLGGTTNQAQVEKPVFPTEKELIGTWIYTDPEVTYDGNDPLASIAISTVKGQVPSLAQKYGVVSGRDYAIVKGSKITLVSGDKKAKASYTYIPSTGKAIITGEHNGQKIILTGHLTIKDGMITILFDAKEVMAILSETSTFKKNSTLQMIAGVIANYQGIKAGATARKK